MARAARSALGSSRRSSFAHEDTVVDLAPVVHGGHRLIRDEARTAGVSDLHARKGEHEYVVLNRTRIDEPWVVPRAAEGADHGPLTAVSD